MSAGGAVLELGCRGEQWWNGMVEVREFCVLCTPAICTLHAVSTAVRSVSNMFKVLH